MIYVLVFPLSFLIAFYIGKRVKDHEIIWTWQDGAGLAILIGVALAGMAR